MSECAMRMPGEEVRRQERLDRMWRLMMMLIAGGVAANTASALPAFGWWARGLGVLLGASGIAVHLVRRRMAQGHR